MVDLNRNLYLINYDFKRLKTHIFAKIVTDGQMGLGFDFNLPVGIIAKIDFTYLVIKKHILFH